MKRSSSILIAATSLLWVLPARSAERPRYGGTLRLELRESPQSLDPTALTSPAVESLSRLVFETLVALDDRGRPQPLLASSWQAEPGSQRWRFNVRSGVSFSDGTPLDAAAVAASLRASHSEWKAVASGDSVIIETDGPDSYLPAELALTRDAIVRRSSSNLTGTGPFTIRQWTPSKHVTLAANDQYWAGRPFLDLVEIELGKDDRDQMMALDLGRTDLAQVAAENIHRAQADNRDVITSQPAELLALVFASEPRSEDEVHTRNALAASIDTAALNNVVLQGGGMPSAGLLPTWLSGYGFLFGSTESQNGVAVPAPKRLQTWVLAYDTSDPVLRIIAQRIVLNARDAGITLELNSSGSADLRLLRASLASSDPHVALAELARTLQLGSPKFNNSSISELYTAEKTLLQSHRVIPLLHVRSAMALRLGVHDFSMSSDGVCHVESVWLSVTKP